LKQIIAKFCVSSHPFKLFHSNLILQIFQLTIAKAIRNNCLKFVQALKKHFFFHPPPLSLFLFLSFCVFHFSSATGGVTTGKRSRNYVVGCCGQQRNNHSAKQMRIVFRDLSSAG